MGMAKLFVLKRDGKVVLRGSEIECMRYVHQTHGFSFAWALAYEGYTIETEATP